MLQNTCFPNSPTPESGRKKGDAIVLLKRKSLYLFTHEVYFTLANCHFSDNGFSQNCFITLHTKILISFPNIYTIYCNFW